MAAIGLQPLAIGLQPPCPRAAASVQQAAAAAAQQAAQQQAAAEDPFRRAARTPQARPVARAINPVAYPSHALTAPRMPLARPHRPVLISTAPTTYHLTAYHLTTYHLQQPAKLVDDTAHQVVTLQRQPPIVVQPPTPPRTIRSNPHSHSSLAHLPLYLPR